jgi:hypothetical protein
MIANVIMNASSTFTADKAIKYDPAKSVLKYKPGDKLSLTSDGVARLACRVLCRDRTQIPRNMAANAAS